MYRYITSKQYKELKIISSHTKMRTNSLISLRVRKCSDESNSNGKPSKYFLQNIIFYKRMVYVKNIVRCQI